MKAFIGARLALAGLLYSGWSGAQVVSPGQTRATGDSAAVVLFDQAQALTAAGKFAEACPKFAESYRLDPQLGALLHLAECLERSGRFASAWVTFRDAVELAERRGDSRAAAAKERALALEPKLSHLAVFVPESSAVQGLEVRRDGVVLGPPLWGTPVPVDPGEHVVEASAPGRQSFRARLRLEAAGEVASVNVPALRAESPTESTLSTDVNPTPRERSGLSAEARTWLGVGSIGLGAVSAVVGVVFHAQRASKLNDRDAICPSSMDCTRDEADRIAELTGDARSAATWGTLSLVLGGAFIGTGTVLLLTAPRATQSSTSVPAARPRAWALNPSVGRERWSIDLKVGF